MAQRNLIISRLENGRMPFVTQPATIFVLRTVVSGRSHNKFRFGPPHIFSDHRLFPRTQAHKTDLDTNPVTIDNGASTVCPRADSMDLQSFQTCDQTQMPIQPALAFRFDQDYHQVDYHQDYHQVEQKLPVMQLGICFKRHGRAILNNEQAQQIFRYKPAPGDKVRKRAGALSKMYGMSTKSIRDIWSGRTWYRATCHLDQSKPPVVERLCKKAGRPRGAKDSKPRVKKLPSDIIDSPFTADEPFDYQIITLVGHGPAIAQYARTNTKDADFQAASVACVQDTRLPIGPDFPGDLSTQPFQDPFDKSLDDGLWEEAGSDPAPIFDPFDNLEFCEPICPFDGLAFDEAIRSAVALW
jgi:hypothetical protein